MPKSPSKSPSLLALEAAAAPVWPRQRLLGVAVPVLVGMTLTMLVGLLPYLASWLVLWRPRWLEAWGPAIATLAAPTQSQAAALQDVVQACMTVRTHSQSQDSMAAASRISIRITSEEQYFYLEGASEQQSGYTDEPKSCRGPKPYMTIPRLYSVRHWHSCKPRQQESITLVTQLSLERLEMLENQCSVWPDPIAAAVYVPTVGGLIASAEDPTLNGSRIGEAVARVSAFHERMNRQGACVLDLELTTEDFVAEADAGLYPFNAARNRALMLARTEAVLLLDADFVPTPTIVSKYKSQKGYADLISRLNKPQAVVLPAFETTNNGTEGEELAMEAVRRGKEFAVREYRGGNLTGFHVRHYWKGHGPTNLTRWCSYSKHYGLKYTSGYEPYVIVSRRFVPWYDERFRGYGYDKIQHLTHLAAGHVGFAVHPTGFVVHVPHQKAPTFHATQQSGQWEKLEELWDMVETDIEKKRFVPVTSFPQLCRQGR